MSEFQIPTDPFGPLHVVAISEGWADPALDLEAMDLDAYRETRDPALVRVHAGKAPRRFVLRRLSPSQVAGVRSMIDPARHGMALTTACIEIIEPDGRALKPHPDVIRDPQKTKFAHLDAWLLEMRDLVGQVVVDEIGRVALRASDLPKGARGPFV